MKMKWWFVLLSALMAIIAGYGSLIGMGYADLSSASLQVLMRTSASIVLPASLAAALSAYFRYEQRSEQVLRTGKSALRFALKVIVGAFVVYLPILVVSIFVMVLTTDWLQAGSFLESLAGTLPNVVMLALIVWVPALLVAFVPALLLQWALCHFVLYRAEQARKQVKK